MKLRGAVPEDLALIDLALIELKTARDHLRAASAKKAAAYVAAALKSAEGARRHAERALRAVVQGMRSTP